MPVALWLCITSWVVAAGVLVIDKIRPVLNRYQRWVIAGYMVVATGGVVEGLSNASLSQALNNLGFALEVIGLVAMLAAGLQSRWRMRSRASRD
jgi:hypothetical protein